MRTAGIIAEYNPLHMGHQYHMERAREITGADYLIAVISGDFVQRGAPAVFDKYERARMALMCGADLVVEMPSVFATGSAEDFSACGIALLDKLGVTDFLFFGSECGDIRPLLLAASVLADEPEAFSANLKELLRQGLSFPAAREKALADFINSSGNGCKSTDFSSPNNILGIEYCKAILKQKSSIKPVTLLRRGNYHNASLVETDNTQTEEPAALYSSASAIRKELSRSTGCSFPSSDLSSHIPECLHNFYETCHPIFAEDFSSLLNYAILKNVTEEIPFTVFEGFSSELSARLEKHIYSGSSWDGRIMELKTRNYTYTRISRALLHMVLGMTSDEAQAMRLCGYAPYARLLGFRKSAAPILSAIKKNSSIPFITKTADAWESIDCNHYHFLKRDFFASHIYQAVLSRKYGIPARNEFTQQLVILP